MKIIFMTVGKENKDIFREAINEYTARLSHYAPVGWVYVKPSASGQLNAPREEESAVMRQIETSDFLVLFDERGKSFSTKDLSVLLDRHLQSGTKHLVFIIGGAFGVSEGVRLRANIVLSLSAFTFPHELARLIAVEQTYRAFTVLRGEKYHHE